MLMPKKVKFRKQQRGRNCGKAWRGSEIAFGDYGLKVLEPAWITDRQIEAARIAMTRAVRRGGKIWIRLFPDKPVTKKPAETRMGKGKGSPEYCRRGPPGEGHLRDGRRGPGCGAGSHAFGLQQIAGQDQVRLPAQCRGRGMTTEQIREFTDEELVSQENDMAEQIFRLRLQLAMGQAEGTHKLQQLKKDVARIKTIRRERQLQQQGNAG